MYAPEPYYSNYWDPKKDPIQTLSPEVVIPTVYSPEPDKRKDLKPQKGQETGFKIEFTSLGASL